MLTLEANAKTRSVGALVFSYQNSAKHFKKKNKTMLITSYQKLHKLLVKNINITLNNQALENVTHEKLLGVVVDQNLTWKGHVNKVHRTVSMLLSKFGCIKPFLPTDAHIKYCQAFIFPHLDYCSTVWGSTKLQRL